MSAVRYATIRCGLRHAPNTRIVPIPFDILPFQLYKPQRLIPIEINVDTWNPMYITPDAAAYLTNERDMVILGLMFGLKYYGDMHLMRAIVRIRIVTRGVISPTIGAKTLNLTTETTPNGRFPSESLTWYVNKVREEDITEIICEDNYEDYYYADLIRRIVTYEKYELSLQPT